MRAPQFCLTLLSLLALASCSPSNQIYDYNPIPSNTKQLEKKKMARSPLIGKRPLTQPSTPAPAPNCKAVCIIDPRTGKILFEYNARTRRQVASTQKLVTALCVVEAGRLSEEATIKASDKKCPRIRMDLSTGDRYRRIDLLRALLTSSYNDVANTLARDSAGSVPAFVNKMNDKARRMGMHDTHFVNPNGLPGAQYSTARDMAIAACWAYNNTVIRRCVGTYQYYFLLNSGKTRRIKSTNRLMRDYSWVNGLKTGYTNAAGRCLISSGTYNDSSVIVVVLGSAKRNIWRESEKYLKWSLQLP